MSDDSLFREVDEEVRRDQMVSIWNRFGTLIMGVCLLVVAGVGSYKAWQYWEAKQAEEAGMRWYNAAKLSNDGKSAEADKAFDEIATSGHAGYAVLARLSKAARLGQDGKRDEAVALYDQVAADNAADGALRELARVRAAYLLVDTKSVDELSARLKGLNAKDSSWRHAVREVLALAHFRAANYKPAAELVAEILADTATPAGMRARMQLVSAHLEPLLKSPSS